MLLYILILLIISSINGYSINRFHSKCIKATKICINKIHPISISTILHGKKGKRIEDEELSFGQKSINDSNDSNDSNKVEITSTVRLKEEVASPFRLLRKFVYGSTGIAGAIGTITTIPQLLIALQDNNDKITESITNIAIDLSAIIGSVLLFVQDSKAEKEKLERFAIKEKEQYQMSKEQIKEREKEISLLPVEIIFSEQNENITRIVSLADLQVNGKQNVICIGGSQSYIKDCMISARIEGSDLFSQQNTYIIPVVLGDDQIQAKTGFGSKDEFMTAPYIGKPTQLNVWQNYLLKEVKLAEMQGAANVLKQGIVLAIKQNGVIIRRGLGLPPWKSLVEEMTKKDK